MKEIAVFTALRAEMSPLRALLSSADRVDRKIPIHTGQLHNRRVILVCSGVGKQRSLEAAALIFSKYCPHGVLSTGFCGGLVRELKPADVVLSSWIASDTTKSRWNSKKFLLGNQASALQRVLYGKGIQTRIGGFVSVPRPVVSLNEKNRLANRTRAMIVEMETFYLGRFFMARKVPFVGMKAVVDSFEDRVPGMRFADKTEGWPLALNMAWHLISHRGGFFDLSRLYKNGRLAQVALARSVSVVIGVWPEMEC